MSPSTAYTIGSVLLTSSVALVCLFVLGWDEQKLRARIPVMIAVTCGVLIGEAVFHLIPESMRRGMDYGLTAGLVLAGLVFSFLLEVGCKLFLNDSELAPVARISLFAESVHNAVDGALIAAAYLTSIRVGLVVTFAIVLHELPHELGNFSVLIHAGYGRKKAFLLNLLSACAALLGALAVLLGGRSLGAYSKYLLPPAAGCFLYIAVFNLIPDLFKRAEASRRAILIVGVAVGAAFMLLVTLTR